jgi:predicted amidohydrolase YtcJ
MQDVRARGDLKHRISYVTNGRSLEAIISAGMQSGFGDEWIKLGATAEHTVDGSFSERTMSLSTPYPNVAPPYQGNLTETQDTLNAWVERVHRAGIQVNCHANGDVAIDMYLTAMERALQLAPRANARPKITHCTLLNPSLIARIKAIGAVPALFTTYAYYNTDKFVFYGEEMMTNCMAFRSLIDAGIYACAGSDFSPGPFALLMGIQGMVTRRGWDGTVWGANQKISVSEAIAVNTYNGAWASGEEAIKGSITAASSPITSSSPTTRTRWILGRSRTFRSRAPWWGARSRIRRNRPRRVALQRWPHRMQRRPSPASISKPSV